MEKLGFAYSMILGEHNISKQEKNLCGLEL
jgi:hypothetical protein